MVSDEPMQGALNRMIFGGFNGDRAAVLLGGFALIVAAFSVVMFGQPAAEKATIDEQALEPLAGQSTGFGTARRASSQEVQAYLNDMFERLDRDSSGYVELAEAPRLQVTSFEDRDGRIKQLRLSQAEWFTQGDGDQDGRVTRTEYLARLIPPAQAILGVPPNWQPSEDR